MKRILGPLLVVLADVIALLLVERFFGSTDVNNLTVLGNIIRDILIAVLASYIFISIVNYPPKLVMNDYMVVRREESVPGNPVSISLFVGNPFFHLFGSLFDVKCTFTYHIEDGASSNSLHEESMIREQLERYYRFTFELKDMKPYQKKFWQKYVSNPEDNKENSIKVYITGTTNRIGGRFTFTREYKLDRIIIGEDSIGALDKTVDKANTDIVHNRDLKKNLSNPLKNNKGFSIVYLSKFWKAFRNCREYQDPEKTIIRNMIMEKAK